MAERMTHDEQIEAILHRLYERKTFYECEAQYWLSRFNSPDYPAGWPNQCWDAYNSMVSAIKSAVEIVREETGR